MVKSILAYGDSLTWGHDPDRGGLRHQHADLWPTVLEGALGPDVRVIADGLGGRTTSFDDGAAPCERNAAKTLPVALGSHMPLDLVIVMLGTNDLKPRHGAAAISAQQGMRRLIQLIRSFPYKPAELVPQILIVAPPPCITGVEPPDGPARVAQSKLFPSLYRALSAETSVGYFDAGTVAQPSTVDGVHLDAPNTRAIGLALYEPVRELLGL